MSEDTNSGRPLPARRESFMKKMASYMKLAADVASIVMDLRDRPSGKDWFSLGLRAVNVGASWYTDRRKTRSQNYWDYFAEETRDWVGFPSEYKKIVMRIAANLEVAPEYLDGDPKQAYVCHGYVGKEQIAFAMESGQLVDGPYFHSKRAGETYDALGGMIWRALGGQHLLYTNDDIILDLYRDRNVIPTLQMESLLGRVRKFLASGDARSYLFGGVPGTGKSIAIRWLVAMLGLTSIRIDLKTFEDRGESSTVNSLETMLRILKPDVVILDDLDRLEVSADMLTFLETARTTCRVVMASANSVSSMSGAQTRPGRFDDIFHFDRLDRNVLERILGEHADLADEVKDLPAAYVAEFERRCRVLGRDEAMSDLDELRARAEETSEDGD